MENQVLSIEQMQELLELGIDISKAHLWWYSDKRTVPMIVSIKCNFSNSTYIPTFTLQDILEMLPEECSLIKDTCYTGICYYYYYKGENIFGSPSIILAAFNMLKWCKQNNYI